MDNIDIIEKWIEDYGCNPTDMSARNTAKAIDDLYRQDTHVFDWMFMAPKKTRKVRKEGYR